MAPPALLHLATELSPELLASASEDQLLLLLPIILHRLHCDRASTLGPPLVARLHASRRLKLRALLLRRHPRFRRNIFRLRYSATAYGAASICPRNACSRSYLDLSLDTHNLSAPLTLKVDMVDLQSDDFYTNVIFTPAGDKYSQIAQQLVCHVFRPHPPDHTPNELCGVATSAIHHITNDDEHLEYAGSDDSDEGDDDEYGESEEEQRRNIRSEDDLGSANGEADNDSFAHFAFKLPRAKTKSTHSFELSATLSQSLSMSSSSSSAFSSPSSPISASQIPPGDVLVELKQLDDADPDAELDPCNMRPMLPSLRLTMSYDVLKFQGITVVLQLFNEVWKARPGTGGDPLSVPFCVTLDATPVSDSRGIFAGVMHQQPLALANLGRIHPHPSPFALDAIVRSAAGALTAAYVLGVSPRTSREVLLKDGHTIFWKAFHVLFDGTVPTFSDALSNGNISMTSDGPTQPSPAARMPPIQHMRLSIPRHLRRFLVDSGVHDVFRKSCVNAFTALRAAWGPVLQPALRPVLSTLGCPQQAVLQYFRGKNSLNLVEPNDIAAQKHFRKWIA